MEVKPCTQKAGSHAASLLRNLSLQRDRAQFCDCVVRQKESPGQLYPAHRSVLAASSPVLASVVSSAGALVEVQVPCLSDSVLALVLDYIYTGTLPYTCSQQQYYNLISAASYLQMDELQEALKTAGHPANHRGRNDASPLNNVRTCTESPGDSVNTGGKTRQPTNLAPLDLIQGFTRSTDEHRVSRVDKELQEDQFHAAGTVKPESWRMSTEEGPVWTVENRMSMHMLDTAVVQEEESSRAEKKQRLSSKGKTKPTHRGEEDQIHHSPSSHLSPPHISNTFSPSQLSSSSSPSTPQPCCEAVPVIRHSSTATNKLSPYNPVVSSKATDSQSGGTDDDRSIPTEPRNHYRAQNKDHTEGQSWDYSDCSDQCATKDSCYKSNADQCGIPQRNCNLSDHEQDGGNGFSEITDENDRHAYQNNDCSSSTRGLEYKTGHSLDGYPSKHRQVDCSDCSKVSTATAADGEPSHSQDRRAPLSLLAQGPETQSEYNCSSRCPAETQQDSHCNINGLRSFWNLDLFRPENSTEDAASSQHDHDDTTMDGGCASQEHENISSTELQEASPTVTTPTDNNMSGATFDFLGQTYRGHLHYHCLSQKDTLLSHEESDHKASHSDESSDDDNASSGLTTLRQHFATTDQVLLLDISTKPAELLVSFKNRSDQREKWDAFSQRDIFGGEHRGDDGAQPHEATPGTGVQNRKSRAGIIFGTKSFDDSGTKTWVGERNVEECKKLKGVSKQQSRPGAEALHNVGSKHHTTAMTVCSAPTVPLSVQAPVSSSSLSVCMPSTISVSVPTNISSHLSAPAHHPFQCSLCDRSFSQRGSLNRHVRSHLGVRPFPCPRCPMTFSRQYRVSEHMRVHQRCVIGTDFQMPPVSSMEKIPQK